MVDVVRYCNDNILLKLNDIAVPFISGTDAILFAILNYLYGLVIVNFMCILRVTLFCGAGLANAINKYC